MNLQEAKTQMRVYYNNGDIPDEVYKVYKSIVKEYEKRLDKSESTAWSYDSERLLINMYNSGRSTADMMVALHRSSRAIDKRINFLKKEKIIK